MKIGVLALQGAFQLHRPHLEVLNIEYKEVVTAQDFRNIDGLILPGGESSVLLSLINTLGIGASLKEFFKTKPTWGICAGAILMAQTVRSPSQISFGALAIEVERNGYGRQLESVHQEVDGYMVSYIRAPIISKVDSQLQVLSERNGLATWVESDSTIVTTFHPEMNLRFPSPWHQRFVGLCGRSQRSI